MAADQDQTAANPADVFAGFLQRVGITINPQMGQLIDHWREKASEPVSQEEFEASRAPS